ncbi:hypothetical protein FS837_000447 [Tulasnella sp. UAMH 9824]|nr:hypothetical protein FS837_000447 [Tulasnella sp. UAMH 9824]
MKSPATATDIAKAAFDMLARRIDQGDTAKPDDSSRSILALDNHINALEALVVSLVSQANNHLSTLQQSRNTLVPIHALPEELLVNVWLICVQEATKAGDLLQTLALVCRSWHQGVLDHPILWCHLQDSCKSNRYKYWVLKKSKNYPLHLRLSSEDPHVSETLVNMAMPECRRWKSFVLIPDDIGPTDTSLDTLSNANLDMLANANLDILSSFEVRAGTTWGGAGPIRLPATPALQEIRLEAFCLQWETFNAPQLRALRINALYYRSDEPSLSQFLDLLRSTPLLEVLLLKDTEFLQYPYPPNPPFHQYTPVHLPHLRALHLSFPADTPCNDLLRLIRATNLQQLLGRTVSFKLWDPPRCPILNSIQSTIPPTGAIDLYYNNDIHIATDPHPFYPMEWPYCNEGLTTKGFAFTTTWPARMRDFLDVAQWVSNLGAHTIVKLELRNPHWKKASLREIPAALVEYLPNLHTLIIRQGVKVDVLLPQLGRPRRESSGRIHWSWPQLVNLDLEKSLVTAEVLIALAESRWGNAGMPVSTSEPSGESTKEERPAKLKSLTTPFSFTIEARRQLEILALDGGPRPEGSTNPSSE